MMYREGLFVIEGHEPWCWLMWYLDLYPHIPSLYRVPTTSKA